MPAADRWGWIRIQVMVGLDYLSPHNQARNHRYFLNQWNLFQWYSPTTVRGWSKVTIGTSSKIKNLQPLTSSPQRSRECPVKCRYIGDKQRCTSVPKLELGDPAFPAVTALIRKLRKNNRGRRHARGDRAGWSSPKGLLRESHLTREKAALEMNHERRGT
jgi:hypothetical protein